MLLMEIPRNEISPERRCNLLSIPWAATAVLTLPGVLHPQFLPAGLLIFFGMPANKALDHGSWLLIGWLLYLMLTAAACLSRRKRKYFIVYSVLCVVLAVNTVGCRMYWSNNMPGPE